MTWPVTGKPAFWQGLPGHLCLGPRWVACFSSWVQLASVVEVAAPLAAECLRRSRWTVPVSPTLLCQANGGSELRAANVSRRGTGLLSCWRWCTAPNVRTDRLRFQGFGTAPWWGAERIPVGVGDGGLELRIDFHPVRRISVGEELRS